MSYQTGIDVTANNLSNSSSIGFKSSSVEFKNLFEKNLFNASQNSSVNSTVGVGAIVQATPLITKMGDLNPTDNSTDLAISGDGWFALQGQGQTVYTRNGMFNFDATRDLVNGDGYFVLGTVQNNFNSSNVLTSTPTSTTLGNLSTQVPIKLPETLTYPAVPTSMVTFLGNLGTDATTRTMGGTMVDAQGNKNVLSLVFTQTVPQPTSGVSWDVTAVASPPKSLTTSETTYDTQHGTLLFDTTGALISSTLSTINNNGTPVTLNVGTGYTGITSNTAAFTASSSSNGTLQGDLVGYKINQNAEVLATFTNGKQVSMAKIGVSHFANDQGLQYIDGTYFLETPNSGKPFYYQDSNGNNVNGSTVLTNFLESSNVDVTAGLTDLIIYQRAYDGSAKLVTTADQMIQKALQMHR